MQNCFPPRCFHRLLPCLDEWFPKRLGHLGVLPTIGQAFLPSPHSDVRHHIVICRIPPQRHGNQKPKQGHPHLPCRPLWAIRRDISEMPACQCLCCSFLEAVPWVFQRVSANLLLPRNRRIPSMTWSAWSAVRNVRYLYGVFRPTMEAQQNRSEETVPQLYDDPLHNERHPKVLGKAATHPSNAVSLLVAAHLYSIPQFGDTFFVFPDCPSKCSLLPSAPQWLSFRTISVLELIRLRFSGASFLADYLLFAVYMQSYFLCFFCECKYTTFLNNHGIWL